MFAAKERRRGRERERARWRQGRPPRGGDEVVLTRAFGTPEEGFRRGITSWRVCPLEIMSGIVEGITGGAYTEEVLCSIRT
ncbi:hypothetical protein GWI33_022517 [Rhynchophorus ferrugineus]|uniref:Uncharacterized protein n=1 Tax=Rhynchophorus ferrugineus TaxID=354439 RepID=A0A834HRX6_RHYFE|nr:hypothetical protein GWI33_022517 [Rhynchophorus ferrugineus]